MACPTLSSKAPARCSKVSLKPASASPSRVTMLSLAEAWDCSVCAHAACLPASAWACSVRARAMASPMLSSRALARASSVLLKPARASLKRLTMVSLAAACDCRLVVQAARWPCSASACSRCWRARASVTSPSSAWLRCSSVWLNPVKVSPNPATSSLLVFDCWDKASFQVSATAFAVAPNSLDRPFNCACTDSLTWPCRRVDSSAMAFIADSTTG